MSVLYAPGDRVKELELVVRCGGHDITVKPSSEGSPSIDGQFGISALIKHIYPDASDVVLAEAANLYSLPDTIEVSCAPAASTLSNINYSGFPELDALRFAVLSCRVLPTLSVELLKSVIPAVTFVATFAAAHSALLAELEFPVFTPPASVMKLVRVPRANAPGAAQSASREDVAERRAARKNAKQSKKKQAAEPAEDPAVAAFRGTRIEVARVLKAEPHPDSDKLFVCQLQVGGECVPRTLVTGLQAYYTAEQLTGRDVVAILNLKPAKLAGVVSEAMLLCASTETTCVTLQPPAGAKVGDRVGIAGCEMAEPAQTLSSKLWQRVTAEFRLTDGVAQVAGRPLEVAGAAVAAPGSPEGAHIY